MPVMEGKCALFKAFGDVDAVPVCIDSKDVDEIVEKDIIGGEIVERLLYVDPKTGEKVTKIQKTETEQPTEKKTEKKAIKKEIKTNKYGVKVGDFFSASWGYEQTNVNFFQVIELVGTSSVRVREVYPKMIDEEVISGMSADRTYDLSNKELLPPAPHSVFIKDQEKGDLKRLKSWAADGISNPQFYLDSFANAHYCNNATEKYYESWYA
jgi:hypothetical protein